MVMGILNVTPDSFSDGGKWQRVEAALTHALEMQNMGADLLDIGGESTRPGSTRIDPGVEQERILPVIQGYRVQAENPLPISVDTWHAETARKAVEAGASIVNDVSGGVHDRNMYKTVAELDVPYICQHMRGTPDRMDTLTDYGSDLVKTISEELKQRLDALYTAGVDLGKVIIDPGLGFAKTGQQSWQLLRELDRLKELGYPILVGASRKRFLQEVLPPGLLDSDMKQRDIATAVVSGICADKQIWAVRVHDVAGSRSAIRAVQLGKGW